MFRRAWHGVLALMMMSSTMAANKAEAAGRETALPSYLVGRGLPAELAALERAGRLTEAEAWLAEHIGTGAGPDDPLVIERERLRRLRRDFSQTPDALLATLRAAIPDVSAADLDAWRADGKLQWATIDGELLYFRKEPRNLFRFAPDARERRAAARAEAQAGAPEGDPNTAATQRYDLHDHVRALLAEAEATGEEQVGRMGVHATHRVTVDAGVVPEGETIRCWIPFPQEYRQQGDVELVRTEPAGGVVAPNGAPQRTVYMEMAAPAADVQPVFEIEYKYAISGYVPKLDAARVTPLAADDPLIAEYTRSEPPHVDITDEVRALAAGIVGDETNPLLKAEMIFRWMDENIMYCSEMEYSIVTSITDKMMTERKGDCGMFVLKFVVLCRAVGIPARWQSGWAMRPENENLHDWAEFYVAPYGWLPADCSYGLRRDDDPAVRDFYFGHIDAYRMIANMDFAAPFTPAKTHWRSDNIDNQRGEVEWSGGNIYYDQFDYEMTVEYTFE